MAKGKIGEARATLSLANDQFMKALNASGKAFVKTAAGMAKIGGLAAAAGAAITTPVLAAAKSFASYGDNLDKMAGRTSMSVESLQELGFAAEQSGASIDNIEKASKKMNETVSELAKGNATVKASFDQLGITFEDLQGLPTDERLKLIGTRIAEIEDPARRTKIAMQVLGEDGYKLMNMFAAGADGIEAYAAQARKLGLVFSEADTKDAAAMTDAMNEAGRAVKAAWLSIGSAVAPLITEITGKVAGVVGTVSLWIRENKQLVVTVFKIAVAVAGIGTALVAAGGAMAAIATVVGTVIASIGVVVATIVSLATSLAAIPIAIVAIGAVAAYQFGLVGSAVDALKETWSAAWGGIVASVMKGDLQTAFDIVWTAVQITFHQGFNVIKMLWRGTKDFILDVWDGVVFSLAKGVETILSSFKLIGKTVGVIFKNILENAKAIGKALMNPIQTAKTLASGGDIGLKTHLMKDLKEVNDQVHNEYFSTINALDDALRQKQDARAAASQKAYENDQAKLAALQEKQNALLKKANEPLVTPEQEKELDSKVDRYQQAMKALSNMTSGVATFSSRALRAGQSLGDKTVKEIKNGIDKLGDLTATQNDLLENMAGPG